MSHPANRAERRHHRTRVIANRRFVYQHVWNMEGRFSYGEPFSEWGRYAKWNLACGSPGCHREKYFGPKRKRREAHRYAEREWENEYRETHGFARDQAPELDFGRIKLRSLIPPGCQG